MQTVGTPRVGATGTLHHLTRLAQHRRRSKPSDKDTGSQRIGNDFLTQRHTSIYPQSVTRTWNGADHNYLTRENYEYMIASVERYAQIVGGELNHTPRTNVAEGISNLYDELNALTNGIGLNIETHEDKLVFVLWKSHRWGNYTFYWLPVKFTETLDGALKRIALTFLHDFIKSNGMYLFNDIYDADMTLEWATESLCEYDDKEEKECVARLIGSYRKGRIFRLMKRIGSKRYYKNLPAAVERYLPKNDYEERLIGMFRDGLQFIGDDKPSIMSYGYDPQHDEDPMWEPVVMERIVRVIYDPADLITEWVEEMVNNDLCESYDISPVTTLTLSPEYDRPFTMDDYPERFSAWFDNFCRLINE